MEVNHWLGIITPYVHRYGYLVAFFGMMLENAGIPVPAETTLISLVLLAQKNLLHIYILLPIAIIGDVTGDCLGYAIGYFGGRKLVTKYAKFIKLSDEQLKKSEITFDKKGAIAVFFGHFFAITRVSMALISGTLKLNFKKYLIADLSAAILYITTTGLLAFYFSPYIEKFLSFHKMFSLYGVVSFIAFFTYFFLLRKKR